MPRNDKITGDPKAPTGIYMDPDALGMYEDATDEYRRVLASGSPSQIREYVQCVPEWYHNEIAVRAIDDDIHGRRR